MDNNPKKSVLSNVVEDEQVFSIRDFMVMCVRRWKWFVASLIFFIALGVLFIARQEPVYRRTCSVLIKSENSSPISDPTSGFTGFNIFGGNKNVQNELISLTSPSVVSEVVRRLDLPVTYEQKGKFHPTTLYKKSNPIAVTFPDLDPAKSAGFKLDLNPNGTIKIYDFYTYNEEGKKEKFDNVFNSRLSFDLIKTPLGRITVQPNGGFEGKLDQPVTIQVAHKGLQSTIEAYCDKLKGDLANQDAEVIDLSIDDVCIQRADDILNTVVIVYNEQWVDDKNRVAVATSNFITERLGLIERELSNVDNDIADFKSNNRMPDIEQTYGYKLQEASKVNDNTIRTRNELAMANYLRDFIINPKNADAIIPVNVGLSNQNISVTIQLYNDALMQREALLANSSSNNPLVRDLDVRLKGLRESIINSINGNIGSLQASLRDMESNQESNNKELSDAPVQAKYLLSIERQQKVKEELYVFLLQKREENELSQTFTAYNTRIITPPYGSQKPISPKKALILIIMFGLGFIVPGMIFYMIEATNTKIRSRKDLDSLQVPFAGEIPMLNTGNRFARFLKSSKRKKEEYEAPKPVVEEGKRDVPNEAFRVVRSNIDFMISKDVKCPVLMLTSFNPGSGKSFICYNLGASFALKGKRVLLIDGDLRHGSLSEYAGAPKKGICNWLTGQTDDWQSLVVKGVRIGNLDILPIGHRPPNPAELLENSRLGELIEEARKVYDEIIIDCPPVNIVVDTQIIQEYVDRTIFVVRAGLLERSSLKEIGELYKENKLKNISVLLNGTQTSYSSYYHYGNYGSYGVDE